MHIYKTGAFLASHTSIILILPIIIVIINDKKMNFLKNRIRKPPVPTMKRGGGLVMF